MNEGHGRTSIAPQPTSIRIAEQLRQLIIDGSFAPGQQISEMLVSRQLRLSRGPLREALQRLSQEGLLVSKRNRGNFVIELTREDVDEIYRAREVLEFAAAEIIAAQTTERRQDVSDGLTETALRLTEAAAVGDWSQVLKLDLEFHTALVSSSDNTRLLRAYTTLATEALICMTNLEQAYPAPASLSDHVVIAQLIASGSITEIRSAFHRHLSL